MGAEENAREERRLAARRKREQKRNERTGRRETIVLADIDGDTLVRALESVITKGGAVRIGATRDGGAWAFGIYGDGAVPYTEYVRPHENVNDYLIELQEYFNDIS